MSNLTKIFLTREIVHFCPTPADADHAYSDGYNIKKNCEWLSAIELTFKRTLPKLATWLTELCKLCMSAWLVNRN